MARGKVSKFGVCVTGVAFLIAAVPVAMSQASSAQESAPAPVDATAAEESLDSLRQAFYNAENDFYGAFNAINSSDEFDVDCRDEVPFGRKDKVHACKAEFLREYEARLASYYSRRMSGVGAKSPPDGDEVDEKQALLREEISVAISTRPEVRAYYAALVKAKGDYEARMRGQ